jgi:hypothetical protein
MAVDATVIGYAMFVGAVSMLFSAIGFSQDSHTAKRHAPVSLVVSILLLIVGALCVL